MWDAGKFVLKVLEVLTPCLCGPERPFVMNSNTRFLCSGLCFCVWILFCGQTLGQQKTLRSSPLLFDCMNGDQEPHLLGWCNSGRSITLFHLAGYTKTQSWTFSLLQVALLRMETPHFYGGVQLSFFNKTRRFNGLMQLAVYFEETSAFKGLLRAGIVNALENHFKGVLQLGILNQVDEHFTGLLQLGVFNHNRSTVGIQVGVVSLNDDDLAGLQIGLVNWGGVVSGAQVGLLNYTERLNGVQIGIINFAEAGTGLQVGLLNFAKRGGFPILPIANLIF